MTRRYQPGDEPVPGIRLIGFLGQGGIGEVWKASAPGGTELAIKFISLSGTRGIKEFAALRLMKRIRHPNLVPLIAYWLRDDKGALIEQDTADVDELKRLVTPISPLQATVELDEQAMARPVELIVAMGLGDCDLSHRLRACQQQGLAGIALQELLGYMDDAARAIDFLNAPRHDLGAGPVGIQHCDIKPFNIMLVGGAVQLCDFGLARIVGDIRTTSTSSGTIAYVAPEFLTTNEPSTATDQYSLAVSYYELRTGRLPYHSEAFAEVMGDVLKGRLDLSGLPEGEQGVIRRAISLDPAARYPSTTEMVQALRRVATDEPIPPVPVKPSDIRLTIDDHRRQTLPLPDAPNAAATAPPRSRRSLFAAGACTLLLLLGSIAIWQFPPRHQPLDAVQSLIDQHRYDEAVQQLDQIIAGGQADLAEAHLLRGTCHLELRDHDKAIADLSEAIRRRQNDLRGYSRRAKARFSQGDLQGAIDDYSQAIKILPASEDLHARGLAHAELKNYQAAIDDFKAALLYSPANAADIYQVRAAVNAEAGDDAAAQHDQQAYSLLQANATAKTDDEWHAKLSEILSVDVSDHKLLVTRAIQLTESICKDSNYEHPAHLDLLALLEAHNGNFERAAQWSQKAVDRAKGPEKADYQQRLTLYREQKLYVRGT